MNTWTDSGLSEAGLIGAKLAVGVEARLPDGPARTGRGGSRRSAEPPAQPQYRAAGVAARTNGSEAVAPSDAAPQRSGRRRATESGIPTADYADSYADSYADRDFGSGSHAAVERDDAAPSGRSFTSAGAAPSSGLTGSFPLTGAAQLYAPAPVPLPSEPLPPEPQSSQPQSSQSQPLESQPLESPSALSASSSIPSLPSVPSRLAEPSLSSASDEDRDVLRSSTDGFLAGGFTSSSSESSWDSGSHSSGMPTGLSGSWSQPVPITPQTTVDDAVSAPTTSVHESDLVSGLSAAVSAPTSLLPMPSTTASHRAESSDSPRSGDDRADDLGPAPRETFNVESETLGSLDSSGLFAALSRHSR